MPYDIFDFEMVFDFFRKYGLYILGGMVILVIYTLFQYFKTK